MRAALTRLVHVAIVAAAFAGCARLEPSRIGAGAPPTGVHDIFVVAQGYHSGLVVRARDIPGGAWPASGDFPAADYFMLGWGERDYYPRDDPGPLRGFRALTVPSKSAIHVVPITGPLARALSGAEIVELRVTAAGFMRMVDFVRQSHELDASGRALVLESGARQPGRFYASSRTFHAFENCNVWVARALESADLRVDPRDATTAGMLLRQVRQLSAVYPAAK